MITRTRRILFFIIVSLLGVFLHFTYNLSGKNTIVGLFSAVNESVWEHLKLLFFPALAVSVFEYFLYGKNEKNYLCARVISILSGMLFIVSFFYTYTGIIGKSYVLIDMLSFFMGVAVCDYIFYLITKNSVRNCKMCSFVCLAVLGLFIFMFIYFTFNPAQLNIFIDSATSTIRYHLHLI